MTLFDEIIKSLQQAIDYNNSKKVLPPYVDDYAGVSEEERAAIWGVEYESTITKT